MGAPGRDHPRCAQADALPRVREREPIGPYPFADMADSHLWICTDKVVSAQFEREEPG